MSIPKRVRRTLRRAGTPNIGIYSWNSGKKVRKFAKCLLHLVKLREYYLQNDLPLPTWTLDNSIKYQRKALSYYLSAYPQIPRSAELKVPSEDFTESLF